MIQERQTYHWKAHFEWEKMAQEEEEGGVQLNIEYTDSLNFPPYIYYYNINTHGARKPPGPMKFNEIIFLYFWINKLQIDG